MKKGIQIHWFYSLLVLLVAGLMVYLQLSNRLHLLFFGMVVSCVVVYTSFRLLHLDQLVNVLIFLAPISFSMDLVGGLSLKMPLELLTILLATTFLIKSLNGLSLPKVKWRHPIVILISLDVVWTLIAAISSQLVEVSFKRSLLKGLFVIGYFFLFSKLIKTDKGRLFRLFGLGLIIPIILIAVHHAGYGFSQNTSFSISRPFFDDHTQYGAIAAFVIPYFLINIRKENKQANWLNVAVLSFLFLAVITSYSRGAWISLLGALGFYLLLKLRVKFSSLLIVVGAGFILLTLNFNTIYDGLRKNEVKYADDVSQHLTSVTNLQNDASNLERINRWVCAYRMFESKPIFGYGPGTYQFFYDLYQTPEYMTRISTHKGDKGNAHSEFFNALSEQGLIGSVIYLLIMIYSLFLGMKVYYRQSDASVRKVCLAALLGLITFYIHGLFNTFSDIAEMMVLVYGSLAILLTFDLSEVEGKT